MYTAQLKTKVLSVFEPKHYCPIDPDLYTSVCDCTLQDLKAALTNLCREGYLKHTSLVISLRRGREELYARTKAGEEYLEKNRAVYNDIQMKIMLRKEKLSQLIEYLKGLGLEDDAASVCNAEVFSSIDCTKDQGKELIKQLKTEGRLFELAGSSSRKKIYTLSPLVAKVWNKARGFK